MFRYFKNLRIVHLRALCYRDNIFSNVGTFHQLASKPQYRSLKSCQRIELKISDNSLSNSMGLYVIQAN